GRGGGARGGGGGARRARLPRPGGRGARRAPGWGGRQGGGPRREPQDHHAGGSPGGPPLGGGRGSAMIRTGLGFDLHPLVDGRPLVLGGVTVPAPRGLGGPSDADVLTHPIGEALLGAPPLGDLRRPSPAP